MNGFLRSVFLLTFSVLAALPPAAAADSLSHRAAVEDLLKELDMENVVETSINRMVEMQVRQSPQLQGSKDKLLNFYRDTIGWDKIKDDMTKIWMESFTEAELKDLVKFYRTPTGQKALQMIPTLMAKGSQLGQQRIQARLPELQQMLQEDQLRQQQQGKTEEKPADKSKAPSPKK